MKKVKVDLQYVKDTYMELFSDVIVYSWEDVLSKYIDDTENALANFQIGYWYEKNKQYSTAVSFYLRAAELCKSQTSDLFADLLYECLIKIGIIFEKLQRRNNTVATMYTRAIAENPLRPEAYYLYMNLCNNIYTSVTKHVSHGTYPLIGESYMLGILLQTIWSSNKSKLSTSIKTNYSNSIKMTLTNIANIPAGDYIASAFDIARRNVGGNC